MKRFWHVEKNGSDELIPQGFSWVALLCCLGGLFPLGIVIWLMVRKLWLKSIIWLFLTLLTLGIITMFGQINEGLDSSGVGIFILLVVIGSWYLTIHPAFVGNKWTLNKRLKNGFMKLDDVSARSESDALQDIRTVSRNDIET